MDHEAVRVPGAISKVSTTVNMATHSKIMARDTVVSNGQASNMSRKIFEAGSF